MCSRRDRRTEPKESQTKPRERNSGQKFQLKEGIKTEDWAAGKSSEEVAKVPQEP